MAAAEGAAEEAAAVAVAGVAVAVAEVEEGAAAAAAVVAAFRAHRAAVVGEVARGLPVVVVAAVVRHALRVAEAVAEHRVRPAAEEAALHAHPAAAEVAHQNPLAAVAEQDLRSSQPAAAAVFLPAVSAQAVAVEFQAAQEHHSFPPPIVPRLAQAIVPRSSRLVPAAARPEQAVPAPQIDPVRARELALERGIALHSSQPDPAPVQVQVQRIGPVARTRGTGPVPVIWEISSELPEALRSVPALAARSEIVPPSFLPVVPVSAIGPVRASVPVAA